MTKCYWCASTEELLDIGTITNTTPQLCYVCGGILVNILIDCVEVLENRSVFINKGIQ